MVTALSIAASNKDIWRKGIIKDFTGISSPFEAPQEYTNTILQLDNSNKPQLVSNIDTIIELLQTQEFI